METTQTPTKTTIRPNIKNMIKTPGGSFHKDDTIGNALDGLTLEQVKHIATETGIDVGKYAHLNNGQQRMTIGGILRKLVKVPEVAEGVEATDKQKEALETATAVLSQINTLASDFRDANKAAADAAAAEKEAAKAEKEAAKAEKDAAKAAKLVKVEKTPDIGDETESEGGTLD